MIEKLHGKCLHRLPDRVIVDVNGVGYGVEVPLSVLCQMPEPGAAVELWIHTYVKEDILRLYGFSSYDQKIIFRTLIGLNGIGPKVALAIMSRLEPNELIEAVMMESIASFESIPGIGKRTAEKLIVELKAKIEKLEKNLLELRHNQAGPAGELKLEKITGARQAPRFDAMSLELVSALENLGYKGKEIKTLVTQLLAQHESYSFSEILRLALAQLSQAKMNVDKTFAQETAKTTDLREIF